MAAWPWSATGVHLVTGESVEGVYVLANDAILPWARSFVRSFRLYNPTLRLCLIPFDDAADECIRLVRQAGGEVLADTGQFARLDRIGQMLELGITPYGKHWFRRFAAFEGPFDRFLYLDSRVVVLGDLSPIVAEIVPGVCDFIHFDSMINEVYQEGPIRRAFTLAGLGHGFNSGMWASRRSLFTHDQMQSAASALVGVRGEMNPRNTDQFFLNYLCDSHAVHAVHFADLRADYTHACWAGDGGSVYRDTDGAWRRWKFGDPEHRRRVPFIHWAGFRLHPAMPHFHMFDRFQTPRYGVLRRCRAWLRGLPGRFVQALRARRSLNTLYHRLASRR